MDCIKPQNGYKNLIITKASYLIFANYFWAYFGVVPLKLLPHTKYSYLCLLGKGMITGGAGATVFYNLKQRHPTLELPVIDYDLALFFQPVLVLGISIGVICNVIFADWMITVLLIVIFIGKKNHLNLSSTPFCYLANWLSSRKNGISNFLKMTLTLSHAWYSTI